MPMRIITLIFFIFISGCAAITEQTVTPFENNSSMEICVIKNPRVKEGFLQAYRTALQKKGYVVKILHKDADISDCKVTSTYSARWRWDICLYMSYAKIEVFKNGEKSAEALYKIVREGASGKFINESEKVRELVNQLFPTPGQL
jgi:hypothetical protein